MTNWNECGRKGGGIDLRYYFVISL